MSKKANIRELALEVSGDLDEEVIQEKLAASVILIKKNKETRDEFSSICHEIGMESELLHLQEYVFFST